MLNIQNFTQTNVCKHKDMFLFERLPFIYYSNFQDINYACISFFLKPFHLLSSQKISVNEQTMSTEM